MIPRWKEAREQFEALIELTPSAQAEAMAELRRRDAELAEIVADLLAEDAEAEADSRATEPAVDRRAVGRFHLRHRIATGRASSVWSAVRSDGAFHQEVAIKLVDVAIMAEDMGCALDAAVGHERRMLALVDSPHVVRLIDAGELDAETEWLALELLEGEAVGDYCRRRSLGLEDRVQLMVDACRGIEACHERDVLHLDVAPGNLLVTARGPVKVIDFGSAAQISATQIGDSVGESRPEERMKSWQATTPAYAAPERFHPAAAPLGPAADVWSLGAVLHELLAGVLPVEVEHVPLAEVGRRKLSEDPAPLHRALSGKDKDAVERIAAERGMTTKGYQRALRAGGLDAVVNAATQRDVSRRTASVRELREDLERWLSGEPVRARRETLTQRATRLARRRPRLTIAGLAIFFALAAGAGALGLAAQRAHASAVEVRRLEGLEQERVQLARSAAVTILQDLYDAIEPLAGTHVEVQKLVSAGIDIASSSEDIELTVWLGDAMNKRAVAHMMSEPWTREGTLERAAECLAAQELVDGIRRANPSHYHAARVAWSAAKVRAIMMYELCDPQASIACIEEAQALLHAFAPDAEDIFGIANRNAERTALVLLQCTFEETYGRWGAWLAASRRAADMLEESLAGAHRPRAHDYAQLHEVRVMEGYLAFFGAVSDEQLADLGSVPLAPTLAALLENAGREAELAFEVLAQDPRRELLISKVTNIASTLGRWHRRLGQIERAGAWLGRARDAAMAPGGERTPAALMQIAALQFATADPSGPPPEIREEEIGGDLAAKLYVEQAQTSVSRGETLEAVRLAERATRLLDQNERRCSVFVAQQEARARIEEVLGHANLEEARKRAGTDRDVYLARAEERLGRAVRLWDETSGDALYKKVMAFERARAAALLDACRLEREGAARENEDR